MCSNRFTIACYSDSVLTFSFAGETICSVFDGRHCPLSPNFSFTLLVVKADVRTRWSFPLQSRELVDCPSRHACQEGGGRHGSAGHDIPVAVVAEALLLVSQLVDMTV